MKRLIIILALIASTAMAASVEVQPWGVTQYLKMADRSWYNATGPTIDTITATGTIQYTAAFRIYSGHTGIEFKPKFTPGEADTDTVRVILYRSLINSTANGDWFAVDSTTHGGRTDTLRRNHQTYFNLAGKGAADSWWKYGIKKLMGVPKLVGFARNND